MKGYRYVFMDGGAGRPKADHPWRRRALPVTKRINERQKRERDLRQAHRRLKESRAALREETK